MTTRPYVVWKDRFSVGNERLDSQHKVMFGLLNDLYDALQEGRSEQRVSVPPPIERFRSAVSAGALTVRSLARSLAAA